METHKGAGRLGDLRALEGARPASWPPQKFGEAAIELGLVPAGRVGMEGGHAPPSVQLESSMPSCSMRESLTGSCATALSQGSASTVFLLYLRGDTFSGPMAPQLVEELHQALKIDVEVVLVHEVEESQGGISFDKVILGTPSSLVEAGLFRPIAIEWRPMPFCEVSIRMLARALGADLLAPSRSNSSSFVRSLKARIAGSMDPQRAVSDRRASSPWSASMRSLDASG